MDDIGMSPDYRSGIRNDASCMVCGELWRIDFLETCTECGEDVCPHCCKQHRGGVICQECVTEEEG